MARMREEEGGSAEEGQRMRREVQWWKVLIWRVRQSAFGAMVRKSPLTAALFKKVLFLATTRACFLPGNSDLSVPQHSDFDGVAQTRLLDSALRHSLPISTP